MTTEQARKEGGYTPACKEVIAWIDSRNPDLETRKAFIEHFEGWPKEKQMRMALDIERRKLERFVQGCDELMNRSWWKRALSWMGLTK